MAFTATGHGRGSTPIRLDSLLRSSSKPRLEDPQLHGIYGLALAYLGRKAEAVREGERGSHLAPLTTQTLIGPYLQHQLVPYLPVGRQA